MSADGSSIEVRLDKPDGELISEKLTVGKGLNLSRREPIKIKIKPVNGVRNIYFVFKGPKTSSPQAFLQLSSIHFKK